MNKIVVNCLNLTIWENVDIMIWYMVESGYLEVLMVVMTATQGSVVTAIPVI